MNNGKSSEAQQIIEQADGSLLDIIDHVLNQGIVITGDVMLGVANIDLIYLGLSVVLCAADRVMPQGPDGVKPKPSFGVGTKVSTMPRRK